MLRTPPDPYSRLCVQGKSSEMTPTTSGEVKGKKGVEVKVKEKPATLGIEDSSARDEGEKEELQADGKIPQKVRIHQ